MIVAACHGIGTQRPGWSEGVRQRLGHPKAEWREINWQYAIENETFRLKSDPAKKTGIVGGVFNTSVYDAIFYGRSRTQQDIQHAVRLQLRAIGEPCILIAHSLGSIIVSDLLFENGIAVKKLITMGSPLRGYILGRFGENVEGYVPPAVTGGWTNLIDPKDVVGTSLSDLIPIVTDEVVHNRRWSHTLRPLSRLVYHHTGYWEHPALLKSIHEGLA